jgi:hypothetical protein
MEDAPAGSLIGHRLHLQRGPGVGGQEVLSLWEATDTRGGGSPHPQKVLEDLGLVFFMFSLDE